MLAHGAVPTSVHELWPWLAIAGLGAFHGLNPGMGWLFAVGLGLQEGEERAVRRALLPIALGHAASIALVVLLFGVLALVVPRDVLRYAAAAGLIGFGAYKLVRARHPRWLGNRVGFRDLTAWSFLMSTAHGAGLMLAPALLGITAAASARAFIGRAHEVAVDVVTASLGIAAAAVALHMLTMLGVAGVVAIVVYRKVGLRFLRTGWVNLDLLWAVSLVAVGALMLVL